MSEIIDLLTKSPHTVGDLPESREEFGNLSTFVRLASVPGVYPLAAEGCACANESAEESSAAADHRADPCWFHGLMLAEIPGRHARFTDIRHPLLKRPQNCGPERTVRPMTFEQVMTVVAVAVGPAGIGLGWWLSELGTTKRARDAVKDRETQERANRAIRVLTAAATVESEGRAIAHATYQRTTNRPPDKDQVMESVNAFNAAMGDLNELILEADVFGPEGLAEIGRTLQEHGRELAEVTWSLQVRFTAGDIDKVQKETLPGFLTAIEKATADVRALLGKDA